MVGVDNINDAYDVRLKQWRLARLQVRPGFSFAHQDICDMPALEQLAQTHGAFDAVINLAARAGVRYSVANPWAYLDANTKGALNLLELCRRYGIPKFVLASTSSIYGANPPLPLRKMPTAAIPCSLMRPARRALKPWRTAIIICMTLM